MHRTKALCRQEDPLPEPRMPWRQGDSANLKASMARTANPKVRLDPDTPVPTQSLQMAHQVRIGKAAVGQKHDLTGTRNKRVGLLPQRLVDIICHRRTAM